MCSKWALSLLCLKHICGVLSAVSCWHFFDIQIHTETKLLPATGLVAVSIVFEGSPKREHQQLEVRVVRGHSLLLPLKITVSKIVWNSCNVPGSV